MVQFDSLPDDLRDFVLSSDHYLVEESGEVHDPYYKEYPDADMIREQMDYQREKTHRFEICGYEAVEKTVMSGSNTSARINVPSAWQGKRVMVVRLE